MLKLNTPLAAAAAIAIALALHSGPLAAAGENVIISEFLAVGGDLPDEDGESSDWIELQNRGPEAFDLEGWYLTDRADVRAMWRLPAVRMEPGAFLLVFASGKDRSEPGSELHTNFRLDGEGEYLALVRPDGVTVAQEYAPAYPAQREDLSYGVPAGADPAAPEARRHFPVPTPGAPNPADGIPGFVADTRFSPDRGYYQEPIQVQLSSATEGAEIRYTLDGKPPTQAAGTLYAGPIAIQRTTVLRARAFKPGLEPTNVDTHTYLFVDDLAHQTPQAAVQAGFPSTWGGTPADYGMDPDVVGPNDRFGGLYAQTIRDDLKSLPLLSIVLPLEDMFGPRGIYANATQGGSAWERAASVELIHPDGSSGFQIDCAIRIQGGYFRQPSATPKHSFRLLFKRPYGPSKLRHPLFGPDAAGRFDTLTLRAGANDGYSWDAARLTEQYTRDQFGRSLQRASGNAAAHGTFVHLSINGFYWGLYNPAERPDHSFSATYYGGEKEDWDSVHDGVATNGDTRAWSQMLQQTLAARTSLPAYLRLKGVGPDGAPDPAAPALLDVANYADYLIVNVWGGNWDWPWKNWWAARDRTPQSTGFKFYCWDFENTMGNNRDRSPLTKNALQNDFSSAGQPHQSLRSNPEYRLEFADRAHRLFFNGGILTTGSLIARYGPIAAGVERAVVAESARWGDQHFNPPLTLREWRTERDWILKTYLPQRSAIVLQQLRAAGLYPPVEAPAFSLPGGPVEPGTAFQIYPAPGRILYTLDGTDPRLPGGAISPTAQRAGGDPRTLLDRGAEVRFLVPGDGSLGNEWTRPGFDDGSWTSGRTGIGFDAASGFADLIATDVRDAMLGKNSSIYLRARFSLDPALFGEGLEGLPPGALAVLRMMYDDGYVAWLNGERVAARNAPSAPVWNSRATVSRANGDAVVFEGAALTGTAGLLRPGENVLAIQGLNATAQNTDFLLVPRLEVLPPLEPLVIRDTLVVRARALEGTAWSALNEAELIAERPLRITEIMYHPAPPSAGGPYTDEDFEFIEIQNVGALSQDLAGVRLEGGVSFDFSGGAVSRLEPGALAVVVRNLSAFASRYAAEGIAVTGEYGGKLPNDAGRLVLRGPHDETLVEVAYDDGWQPSTDGRGPSLVVVEPRAPASSWPEPGSWRASRHALGSPGIDEWAEEHPLGRVLPGDFNGDARLTVSDPIALLRHLLLGGGPPATCGEGGLLNEGNRTALDVNGDGGVDVSDPIHLLGHLFLRGPPPALGTACVAVRDCANACSGN
jgi:hypothetical protein